MPRSQPDPHSLRFEIPVERLTADISAKSPCFEAAERRTRIVEVVRVDPDRAGTNGLRRPVRLLYVPGPYPRRESVDRVVRQLHALIEIVECQHGQDGPEDLFARDRHLGLHAVEHRCLDVIALTVRLDGLATRN